MDILYFALFLLTCGAAGSTGMLFAPGEWYKTLRKPVWTPPDLAFPIVWTSIYLLISFAGMRVVGMEGSSAALAFWAMQAAFSTLWSPVFFGMRHLRGGLYVMVFLWPAVAAATYFHWQVDVWAGLAFLPYLLWVSVAAALNVSVWRLNPGAEPIDLNKV